MPTIKGKNVVKIVEAPEISLIEGDTPVDVLIKFYRAIGWNGKNTLDPRKVRTTQEVYNYLHGIMLEKCIDKDYSTIGFLMVNNAPGVDDNITTSKIYLLEGWTLPPEGEVKMNQIEKVIIEFLKTPGNLSWDFHCLEPEHEDDEMSWIVQATVVTFDEFLKKYPQDEEDFKCDSEERPTHVCRLFTQCQFSPDIEPLNLVDGVNLFFVYNADTNMVKSVYEDIWNGNQPAFFGGSIEDAKAWVSELGEVCFETTDIPPAGWTTHTE